MGKFFKRVNEHLKSCPDLIKNNKKLINYNSKENINKIVSSLLFGFYFSNIIEEILPDLLDNLAILKLIIILYISKTY